MASLLLNDNAIHTLPIYIKNFNGFIGCALVSINLVSQTSLLFETYFFTEKKFKGYQK